MYSIFNCSSAAATSASLVRANSLGKRSSASPAPLIAVTSSRVVSGFCAANNRASITWLRLIFLYYLYALYPYRALDRFRDPIPLPIDLLHLAALDQQPDLRF